MISDPESPGILGTVRALAEGLLASAQDRLALFSLELEEEKLRLIRRLIWIGAACFAGAMALTFGSLAVVFAFWGKARIAALGGLALAYAAALIAAVLVLRRDQARRPRPFSGTLREITRDRACLRPED